MAPPKNNGNNQRAERDYRVSEDPVARFGGAEIRPADLPEMFDLPALIGGPLLFAIARDPRTIFIYWHVDWSSVFGNGKPKDRRAHLRVFRGERQESSTPVEPMVGSHSVTVSHPGAAYRIEIGYYQPAETWQSVATSDEVTVPVDGTAENFDVDVATIPFHLSFQRLIDLFRAKNGDALVEIISRLQKRAVTEDERALLSPEDWEVLHAMDLSLDEVGAARRVLADSAANRKLQQRAEAVLGFGATSPAQPFGGSSWTS